MEPGIHYFPNIENQMSQVLVEVGQHVLQSGQVCHFVHRNSKATFHQQWGLLQFSKGDFQELPIFWKSLSTRMTIYQLTTCLTGKNRIEALEKASVHLSSFKTSLQWITSRGHQGDKQLGRCVN